MMRSSTFWKPYFVLLVLRALEGVLAEQHHVQHDAAGPDVCLGAIIVRFGADHLRRCVSKKKA